MNSKIYFIALFILLQQMVAAQDTTSASKIYKPTTKIYKGLVIYPFQKQIGYRSNLTKTWFSDFKGGMTFSALPFFVLEYNRNRRFVNTQKVKVYAGIGVTFDSYVPGIQSPIGIEFIPIQDVARLSIIAEVAPKLTLGPTNFMNISFSPHIGIAYYLREKTLDEKH
jgi:hypothetical protein